MYKVLIKNYIANLSPIQVKQFALSKNVELTEEEANYFTSFVKKNWEILLYQDSSYLFEEVKSIPSGFAGAAPLFGRTQSVLQHLGQLVAFRFGDEQLPYSG